ncbi:MAG TPA: flagellar basal body L-ring protein FlgH [Myxococcaceae bacterium]|nr:flagellar basal body L-ring protein FlgH [Myxococcaceae bacterium]
MRSGVLSLLVALVAGCTTPKLGTYVPRHRDYDPPAPEQRPDAQATSGSLWRDGTPASMLFTDARALHESDLVVVKVEEVADAKRSADTDLTHQSDVEAKVAAFLNNVASQKELNISGGLKNNFNGDGSTGRTERLTATVPALVRKVLPNGNLFIEGHRVILVNSEEHHFYISGVVRPIDIDQQNSVKSAMIADAEIEFTGQGVLSENQRQGWLSKLFNTLWPF